MFNPNSLAASILVLVVDKENLSIASLIITGKEYQIGMPYNFPSTILEANSSLRPITSSRLKELNITSNSSVILFSLFSFLLKE